ncbi:hypothetical protein [Fredinandcohnia sp. 179-A 10B2 NHS]|uniref:hypothetical protein n=1 Tax=Fredinandcohnia sp. 179-A 10B2 NHS TaxID=3235176 RepID=UPI0039A3914A
MPKLNPCPEPSDNGQGRENDNGEGKHCGNNGNPVHNDPNNTDTVETIEGRREETVGAPMNNEVSVESLEVADLVTEETPEE